MKYCGVFDGVCQMVRICVRFPLLHIAILRARQKFPNCFKFLLLCSFDSSCSLRFCWPKCVLNFSLHNFVCGKNCVSAMFFLYSEPGNSFSNSTQDTHQKKRKIFVAPPFYLLLFFTSEFKKNVYNSKYNGILIINKLIRPLTSLNSTFLFIFDKEKNISTKTKKFYSI